MRAAGVEFTREMRQTHTIYIPDMLPYHGQLLCAAFRFAGYRAEIVPEASEYPRETCATVSQDYCSPGIHIIGNALAFVKKLEREKATLLHCIAFLEPQTGGICKAGNLYHALRNSLRRSGYGFIPVISLNPHGRERNSGFSLTPKLLFAGAAAVCYGDLLMTLLHQTRPRERHPGQADRLYRKWCEVLCRELDRGRGLFFRREVYRRIAESFRSISSALEPGNREHRKPFPAEEASEFSEGGIGERQRGGEFLRVGISGEIFSKCAPSGNRHLEEFLQEQGIPYRMGGFLNYLIYAVFTERCVTQLRGTPGRGGRAGFDVLWPGYSAALLAVQAYLEAEQRTLCREIRRAGFVPDSEFRTMKGYAADLMSTEYNIGDGWLVAAEASDFAEHRTHHVLLCHPFTCLVSHVGSRGVLKKLKEKYPDCSFTSIEYDIHGSKAMLDTRVILGVGGIAAPPCGR